MSGFRFGTACSPPRRPTVQGAEQSPFCTSPSQLQEVTLDTNMNTFTGRSPGKSSPLRGHTMKEYEEQLSHLKKENFNLKLRIYFLEERTGHMIGGEDKEDVIKNNIELKVEVETLRKEISDKQDLLCQASKALELMEDQHHKQIKQLQDEHEVNKEGLLARIEDLQKDLKNMQGGCLARTCGSEAKELKFLLQQRISELESQVNQLECNLQEENEQTNHLENELQCAQQETQQINVRCQGLESQLKQRDSQLEDLIQELQKKGQDLANSNHRIRVLEEALSTKEPEIQIKVQELSKRDHIIEEKQSQIERQDKVLVEIQITLDEKQRQIDNLHCSLTARDESIAILEGRLEKARAAVQSMETKLDASLCEANRLREEVETLKIQQRHSNRKNREVPDGNNSPILLYKGSNQHATSGSDISPSHPFQSCEEVNIRKLLDKELAEKGIQVKSLETSATNHSVLLQKTLEVKEEELRKFRSQAKEIEAKFKEMEGIWKEKSEKVQASESRHTKALQTIQSFTKICKDLNKDVNQLKCDVKKKDHHIRDLTSELNELREACNKAKWEAHQLQARAHVQGAGGVSAAFDEVRDMTEEENERLWAEVEDKNKKLLQLTEERDNLSIEMEKQVQSLLKTLKEKEGCLEEYEKQLVSKSSDVQSRDNRILELEQELQELRALLKKLQEDREVRHREESQQTDEVQNYGSNLNDDFTRKSEDPLVLELADKKREIEHLNAELRKRTTNLQELVNKELWDKNREIEKLQDRLNHVCGQKEVEIMALHQQMKIRDFQFKTFQDKVSQLGLQISLPSAVLISDLQPVTINQQVHIQSKGTDENESKQSTIFPVPACAQRNEVPSLQDQSLPSAVEGNSVKDKLEKMNEHIPQQEEILGTASCSQCLKLKGDAEHAETLHKEANQLCTMLMHRLEELAKFLNILLKCHKCLGNLGSQQRQILEQVVESSLELSQTLSLSFFEVQDHNNSNIFKISSVSDLLSSVSGLNTSLLEQWGEDIDHSDSDSLNVTVQDCTKFNDYENVRTNKGRESKSLEVILAKERIISEQAQVIKRLCSQVDTLTKEVNQREMQISHNENAHLSTAPLCKYNSDSVSAMYVEYSDISNGPLAFGDTNECKESEMSSFNSMTFYNSHHHDGGHWCKVPDSNAGNNNTKSYSKKEDLVTVVQHPVMMETNSRSLSVKKTCSLGTGGVKLSTNGQGYSTTLSSGNSKIQRSSSVGAVTTNAAHMARHGHEYGVASMSESEAWSEPDRNVSMARIGLQDDSSKAGNYSTAWCIVGGPLRSKGARIKEVDLSSESSEETAREMIRTPGKRLRGDIGYARRLQSKIRGLEQVNEALRAELNILHQMKQATATSTADVLHPHTRDVSVNTSRMKLDKSTSVEELQDDDTSVTIPANLLEQIRYQREKLESSLFHNEFIRRQLEAIFTTITNCQAGDIVDIWKKLKEATEELCMARSKVQELEAQVLHLETQLQETKGQAHKLKITTEQLQIASSTIAHLKDEIANLQTKLKEKDNELLEQNCLLLESANKCEEQRIAAERTIEEANSLRDEFKQQVQERELLLQDSERRYRVTLKQLKDSEKLTQEMGKRRESMRNETSERIKKIEMEIYEAEKRRNDAEIQVIEAKKQLQEEETKRYEAEWKLQALEEKMKLREEEFEKHYQEMLDRRVKEIELRTSLQIHDAEKKFEQKERLYKIEAEKKVQEAERLGSEFETGLRHKIEEAEKQERMIRAEGDKRIKELEERYKSREADLKKRAQEYEQLLRKKDSELRRQLDEASMKHSQIALECTRLQNEKMHLEQELRRQEAHVAELTREKKDIENLLTLSKDKLETQVLELEQTRNDLERRVKELEYLNSELEQRFGKPHLTDSCHSYHTIGHLPGPLSTSLPYRKTDTGSSSSGLDTYSGDGGSLPSSPWSLHTGTADDRSRKDDSHKSGCLSALSNIVLQQGFNRQRSELSDYMSEEQPVEEYESLFTQMCSSSYWMSVTGQQHSAPPSNTSHSMIPRNFNSSPDLGIESDQGRFSSLETSTVPSALMLVKTVECTVKQTDENSDVDGSITAETLISRDGDLADDYARLQKENSNLKRDLIRTRRSLKATLSQLTSSNNLKQQLEHAICKQMHKTHHILKLAQEHYDGESMGYLTGSADEPE